MRVRTFKPQFADAVRSGTKRQTIRPTPKRMPNVGDHESWRQWTGRPYNSPQIELAQVELTEVSTIKINQFPGEDIVIVNGKLLPLEDYHSLAVADGFGSFTEMAMWFYNQYGDHFEGILIKAKDHHPVL